MIRLRTPRTTGRTGRFVAELLDHFVGFHQQLGATRWLFAGNPGQIVERVGQSQRILAPPLDLREIEKVCVPVRVRAARCGDDRRRGGAKLGLALAQLAKVHAMVLMLAGGTRPPAR